MKQYNYKDNFEELSIRHDYLRKVEKMDGEAVKEFAPIIETTAHVMYEKLKPNFDKVGFNKEDIASLSNLYLISYIGLYSFRNNEDKLKEYIEKFKARTGKEPTEAEIARKDRNNLINFLRQRIQQCSTVCARKARNITVGRDRRQVFAETTESKPASDEVILESYKDFGYRKVTKAEHKEAKERAKKAGLQELFDKDGFRIIEIEILNKGIGREDYRMFFDEESNQFLMTPERTMIEDETQKMVEYWREEFNALDESNRRIVLENFIEKNRGNRYLKKELSLARKMLKTEQTMV